jgi:hypothetical protein
MTPVILFPPSLVLSQQPSHVALCSESRLGLEAESQSLTPFYLTPRGAPEPW